jgi:hypothetical protein
MHPLPAFLEGIGADRRSDLARPVSVFLEVTASFSCGTFIAIGALHPD